MPLQGALRHLHGYHEVACHSHQGCATAQAVTEAQENTGTKVSQEMRGVLDKARWVHFFQCSPGIIPGFHDHG